MWYTESIVLKIETHPRNVLKRLGHKGTGSACKSNIIQVHNRERIVAGGDSNKWTKRVLPITC